MSKYTEKTEGAKGERQATVIPQHAAMVEHPEPDRLEDYIAQPYMPRANVAISKEKPEGSMEPDNWRETHKRYSVLQQHCLFFDLNGDGTIHPWETFMGFWRLGFNVLVCLLAVPVIHFGFSYATQESWVPDPLFGVRLVKLHRTVHGSHTGVYDREGRFIPHKFEEIFSKFSRTKPDHLTFREGLGMIAHNRQVMDVFGWNAALLEWSAIYLLIWPQDHLVSKEDMRTMYDGSLFYRIAEQERKEPRKGLIARWHQENRA